MAASEELSRELQEIELEIREAAGERHAVRLRRLQKRHEIIRKQLERPLAREKQGRMSQRLRDSVPVWTLLTLFVAALSGVLVAPLADTPLERHAMWLRVLALGGIVFCLVVGVLAPFVDVLRTLGRYLGRPARALAALVAGNKILAVSSLLTAGLILLLGRGLGEAGAAAIALGLVVTNAGITIGLVRTFGPRFAGEGRVDRPEPWRFDFIDHFDDPSTAKSCGLPSEIQVKQEAHSVGIVKRAIFEHPPASGKTGLTYIVEQLPHDLGELQLEFFVGVLDEARDEKTGRLQETSRFDTVQGNRILFEIWVNEGLVFCEERDSVGWSEFKSVSPIVPIEDRLIVSFRTDAMGHPQWNWAAWGEPRLTRLRAKSSAPA